MKPDHAVLGEDEAWPDLSRDEILESCGAGTCPFCGQEAMKLLGLHFRQRHGVAADEVREHYGFKYGQSFNTPEHTARMAAINRRNHAERPELRAKLAAARMTAAPSTRKRRPQTIEKLRTRGPEWGAALVRYRETHPEEMSGFQSKAIAAAQARHAELCADQDWLDRTIRRFPLRERKEMARRFEAGDSIAEIARAYSASPTSIAEILQKLGVVGSKSRRKSLSHYRYTVEQEQEIVRRRAAGEGAAVLATEFGCSTSFVYYLARRERRDLIPREIELLRLLSTTAPRTQIAEQLGIARNTLVYHQTTILHKLQAKNRAEAVRKAVALGLIEAGG